MYKSDVEAADAFLQKFKTLKTEISKVIVGQEEVIDQILISVFSKGHALLVGVPGLAKTLMINTIAECMGLSFNRIQFTPDLMPSDIIGAEILDESRNFKFLKGPVFANIVQLTCRSKRADGTRSPELSRSRRVSQCEESGYLSVCAGGKRPGRTAGRTQSALWACDFRHGVGNYAGVENVSAQRAGGAQCAGRGGLCVATAAAEQCTGSA